MNIESKLFAIILKQIINILWCRLFIKKQRQKQSEVANEKVDEYAAMMYDLLARPKTFTENR